MSLGLPSEQLQRTVDSLVADLFDEVQLPFPPVDAFELSQRLGLTVAHDPGSANRGRFVRLAGHDFGQGTVILADDPRHERQQWALAHEIGETQVFRLLERLGVPLMGLAAGVREQLASLLAQALLLPRKSFLSYGDSLDWDLLEMKAIFPTASHELIARRMLEMPTGVIITLFDQGTLVWRKGNCGRPCSLSSAERRTWQTVRATAKSTQFEQGSLPVGVVDIRCWPVYESQWKREILRTELDVW